MNLISDEETKKNYYYSETYQGWDLDEALNRVKKAQLASCEKEFAEKVEALQAEIASLKNDVNALNDIVRFKTDMGQGEIDSLSVDIEAIKREAEQERIRKVVEWAESSCPHNPEGKYHSYLHGKRHDCEICWQAKLKEWGIEEK